MWITIGAFLFVALLVVWFCLESLGRDEPVPTIPWDEELESADDLVRRTDR